MKYYYFNPFSKQYYFPACYKQYSLFKSFYHPYTFKGRIMWFVWNCISFFSSFFSVKGIECFFPIENIIKHISSDSILAFNLGTPGVEQKISILGVEKNSGNEFFMKYACTKIACENVNNEAKVLSQLGELKFVPKILKYIDTSDYVFIKTDVFKGDRLSGYKFDKILLDKLLLLSEQVVVSDKDYSLSLKSGFAHGDFCPWNMMFVDGDIYLYDWEFAGNYPLGYDLFTYIFQPAYLLHNNINFDMILNDNIKLLGSYFNTYDIKEWESYLSEFAEVKISIESQKGNESMIELYTQIKDYARKI